ncbi:nucleoside monophosphate kinase [Burkholderia gladioli]|uniref:nucleoside monophosphate kinase n=1 Tax=Burkholderia gladioli TaxID=28095 RepID=UPI00163E8ECB|nr:nucleoside monophosphate kinase [Burkholderia gladioli]
MTYYPDKSGGDIEKKLIVPRIEISGYGAFILTGPSSCGKGEVAKSLCKLLSIPEERWLSMGSILRYAYERAYASPEFMRTLSERYQIGNSTRLLESIDASDEVVAKVTSQQENLTQFLRRRRQDASGESAWQSVSSLEWLEYCTVHGLLVPNRWTQSLIEAHLDLLALTTERPFIIDGYPRTKAAAKHLLDVFQRDGIPIFKVLHLSISKQEMLQRAEKRQRVDDNFSALLKRYEFYIESVQPSVDYLKERLGSEKIALIDAHQPDYDEIDGVKTLNLTRSINNVVHSSLVSIGLSRILSDALMASRS